MHDIFISYSSVDRPTARTFAEKLESEGFKVWWDRDIPAGSSFDAVIEKAINEAKVIVVLWSEHSVISQWTRVEAEEGRKRGVLVPVLIEQVSIPLAFRNIQAADLSTWAGDEKNPLFRKLVDDIKRLADPLTKQGRATEQSPSNETTSDSVLQKQPKPDSRSLILKVVIAVVVVAAAIFIFKLLSNDPSPDYAELLNKGERYFDDGQYDSALVYFEEARTINPDDTEIQTKINQSKDSLIAHTTPQDTTAVINTNDVEEQIPEVEVSTEFDEFVGKYCYIEYTVKPGNFVMVTGNFEAGAKLSIGGHTVLNSPKQLFLVEKNANGNILFKPYENLSLAICIGDKDSQNRTTQLVLCDLNSENHLWEAALIEGNIFKFFSKVNTLSFAYNDGFMIQGGRTFAPKWRLIEESKIN